MLCTLHISVDTKSSLRSTRTHRPTRPPPSTARARVHTTSHTTTEPRTVCSTATPARALRSARRRPILPAFRDHRRCQHLHQCQRFLPPGRSRARRQAVADRPATTQAGPTLLTHSTMAEATSRTLRARLCALQFQAAEAEFDTDLDTEAQPHALATPVAEPPGEGVPTIPLAAEA